MRSHRTPFSHRHEQRGATLLFGTGIGISSLSASGRRLAVGLALGAACWTPGAGTLQAQTDTTGTEGLPVKYTYRLTEARHKYNIQNLRGALTDYRALLEELPEDPRILLWMARCHFGLRREDLAWEYLNRVQRADPLLAESERRFQGQIQHRLAQYEAAIDVFQLHLAFDNPKGEERAEVERWILECRRAWAAREAGTPQWTWEDLGLEVNSRFDEYGPHWSPDGRSIGFTSRRDGGLNSAIDTEGDHRFFSDIYVTEWVADGAGGGRWGRAVLMPGALNTAGYDDLLAWPASGKSLLVYRNNEALAGDICVSTRQDDGTWGDAVKLPKPINSSYFEGSTSISPDGSKMFFVSERPTGLGYGDLYFSEMRSGGWTQPEPVGAPVNTELDEKFVQALGDGRVILFASNGHAGFGDYDLYRAEWVDGGWSVPVNLGLGINGPREESTLSLSADGNSLLLAAERFEGLGERDLYRVDVSQHPRLGDRATAVQAGVVTVRVPAPPGAKSPAGCVVRVMDADKGGSVLAEATCDRQGQVTFRLADNVVYHLEAKSGERTARGTWSRIRSNAGPFTDELMLTW